MQNKKVPSASEIRSTFHKIYYKDIQPLMAKEEQKRQFELLKLFITEAVLITIFIGLVYNFFMTIRSDHIKFLPTMLMISIPVIVLLIPYFSSNSFAKKLKKNCMRDVITAFGNMQWYNKEVCPIVDSDINTDYQLRESELFSLYNRRSDDDMFEGSFKDVKFTISETNLSYETGSGKNRTVRHVFDGVIINFDANKTIKNKTIIATKNDTNIKNRSWSFLSLITVLICLPIGIYMKDMEVCFYSGLGLISFIISIYCEKINKNKEVLNEIKLEDPEFNKKYKAYSSDEVEGRYLITTAFMERFKNLQTAFGARGAKCSFYGESLMFAISTNKNLFEIGNLFTPLNSPKQLEKFFNELISILALIDYFKLDEKTGL